MYCFFTLTLGYNYLRINRQNDVKPIWYWGFGTQAHIFSGLHFVGEIFFFGDPYVSGAETAFQVAFRTF